MRITVRISEATIANLMVSAIESGDPVTTASKGGWCNSINTTKLQEERFHNSEKRIAWYANPDFYRNFCMKILVGEYDEDTGKTKEHTIRLVDVIRGLEVLARKFPEAFKSILADETDATDADIFLQCVIFGEEKYA